MFMFVNGHRARIVSLAVMVVLAGSAVGINAQDRLAQDTINSIAAETLPSDAVTLGTQFYLVGLGPGASDLITLRAVNVIRKADVIFCRKRNAQMLGELVKGKELHFDYWRLFPFYGVSRDDVPEPRRTEFDSVDRTRKKFIELVRQAVQAGKTVAVLDMGDPLVFGPSAWTLEEFADLNPVVVPGVSAFNAANAALKRGVTASDRTKSVTLTAADWIGTEDTIEKMSIHRNTMVLFTMRTEFAEFIEKLSINYPPETPIAIVQHAGDPLNERVIYSTLGKVLTEVDGSKLPFEYMIYVGDFLSHKHRR